MTKSGKIGEKVEERNLLINAIKLVLDEAGENLSATTNLKEEQSLEKIYADKLKHQTAHKLNNAYIFIQQQLDESCTINEKRKLLFYKNILTKAQQLRRDYTRHAPRLPMERNYAAASLFSASNPQIATIIKKINTDGAIEETVESFRTVTYYNERGRYLKTTDFKVFLGLQRLWEIKGENAKFTFQYEELCEIIGYENVSGIHQMLDDSFKNLFKTHVQIIDYKDSELTKKKETILHQLFPTMVINHQYKTATITFNQYLHNGLKNDNKVWINFFIFCDLSSDTSKLLYPLLTSIYSEEKDLDLDKIINALNLMDVPRKRALKLVREAFQDLIEFDVILDFEMTKKGKSYKNVNVVPSEELLIGIDSRLVISE